MYLIHLHLRILISWSIGRKIVLFQRLRFNILLGQKMRIILRKLFLMKTSSLLQKNLEGFHISHPYMATGSTFDLKMKIYVVVANCADFQMILGTL